MIQPFGFKWIIEKKNIVLKEDINYWDWINYEQIYFTNSNNFKIGIKNNQHFFVNAKEIDFKIFNPELIPFQYKTNTCNLQTGKNILTSYTIGLQNDNEQYYFLINRNNIFFYAEKNNNKKIILIL